MAAISFLSVSICSALPLVSLAEGAGGASSLLKRRRWRGRRDNRGNDVNEEIRLPRAGRRMHKGVTATAATLLNACIGKKNGKGRRIGKIKFPYRENPGIYNYIYEKITSSEWFRSTDLGVMGPARFHCATLLCTVTSFYYPCIG